MRYINNGCFYTVQLSANDVSQFARKWLGFGSIRPVWFQFSNNGDLIDCSDNSGIDDAASVAMSHDAQTWAAYWTKAQRSGRKTVTVDNHHVFGTRGTDCVMFLYRGHRARADIFNPHDLAIQQALEALNRSDDFTHWKDKKTGRVSLIVGLS